MVTKEQMIMTLESLWNDQLRFAEATRRSKRKMRPSERAMALAHYAHKAEVLRAAIDVIKEAVPPQLTPLPKGELERIIKPKEQTNET